jgi:hypothetical protein
MPVTDNHKLPPYGFPNKFPPHVYQSCNYKDFKKSCVHEILPAQIVEKIEEAMELIK